jgi:hypothetical protein
MNLAVISRRLQWSCLTSPPGTPLVKKRLGPSLSRATGILSLATAGVPPKATGKGGKRSAKGSKKGQKRCPQWVAITSSYDDDDKEADDSYKEHVAAIEHDFKHKVRQPTDHF